MLLLLSNCWGWVEYFDVAADKIKALKSLYPGYHNQEPATMTLSLTAPGQ